MTERSTGAPRVAVVGLGKMGTAIAEMLLRAGYPVAVFNQTPGRAEALQAAGATELESAASALARADVCLSTLADDQAVLAMVCGQGGVLAGAPRGTTLIELSTISVGTSARVAEAAEEAGVDYVRGAISGNPASVRAWTAAIFASGPESVLRRVEPLLESITPKVRFVGDGERAKAVKLALQILIGGTAELLAEALVLGEAAGVDRKTLLDTIGASVVGSTWIGYKTDPLLRNDYSATFTTELMAKDVDLVLGLAEEVGVELPVTAEVRTLLEETSDAGHADKDFIALLLLRQERASGAAIRKGR